MYVCMYVYIYVHTPAHLHAFYVFNFFTASTYLSHAQCLQRVYIASLCARRCVSKHMGSPVYTIDAR